MISLHDINIGGPVCPTVPHTQHGGVVEQHHALLDWPCHLIAVSSTAGNLHATKLTCSVGLQLHSAEQSQVHNIPFLVMNHDGPRWTQPDHVAACLT
jgi:hypothetical protein